MLLSQAPLPPAAQFQILSNAFLKTPIYSSRAQNNLAALEALVQQGLYPDRVDVVEVLLAASKVKSSVMNSREKLISSAQTLLGKHAPLKLQVEVIQQQSTFLRLKGNIKDSTLLINQFLSETPQATAEVFGPLYISQAKNFTYNFSFSQAHEEAKKYVPITDGELKLLWDHIYCVGRIMRGEGRFEEARECFELCRSTPGLSESRRLLIISVIADLHCELDYQHHLHHATINTTLARPLSQARHWLLAEMHTFPSQVPSKGYRRILLSLVELEIRLGYHKEARHRLDKLLQMYRGLTKPDIVDRLGHVRALMAAARVSDLQDAIRLWTDALHWNSIYNPLEEEVFTCGVIYMFLCLSQYKLGNSSRGRENLEHAQKVFERERRQFLIPGVGTYLLDFVVNEVGNLTGWTYRTGSTSQGSKVSKG